MEEFAPIIAVFVFTIVVVAVFVGMFRKTNSSISHMNNMFK